MANAELFKQAGIIEGKEYEFGVRTPTDYGFREEFYSDTVERIATGGGFGGSVVLLSHEVIKTGEPDSIHKIARDINWPVPYTIQASQTAAELADIVGKVLYLTVPALTKGRIITPAGLGYSHVSKEIGYGNHIERMNGKSANFHDGGCERKKIKAARQEIWDLRHKLGAEHVAQVHPDNPFGKPNLWLSPKDDTVLWFDYLPAIWHTGKVKPWYNFPFHYEVQQEFGRVPTFDKLHTKKLRDTLHNDEQSFSLDDKRRIEDLLELYDERWKKHEDWLDSGAKDLFITDWETRGVISKSYAEQLRDSDTEFKKFRLSQFTELGVDAYKQVVSSSPFNIFDEDGFMRNLPKLRDTEYRRKYFAEHSLLWGAHKAYEEGILTEDQFQEIISAVPPEELGMYIDLQMAHILWSRITDALTVPLLATIAVSPNHALAALGVGAFNTLGPGVFRFTTTSIAAAKKHDKELFIAAIGSLIPVVGNYLPIPAKIAREYGEKAGELIHYNLRGLVAAVSKIRAGGGWNSDFEEELWEKGEAAIEKTKELFNR